MKTSAFKILLAGLVLVLTTIGCDSTETIDLQPGTVTVQFNHAVSGEALVFDQERYLNTAANRYGISLLEYIVSDISLEDVDGNQVLLNETWYVNAADLSTHSFTIPNLEAGTYTKLSFVFGLVRDRNQPGSLPNIEHFNNLVWPGVLGGGYHYMRIEGRYLATEDSTASFLVHTGPTSGLDNSVPVLKTASFSVDGNAWTILVEMDVNEWFEDPNTFDFDDFPGSIMPNQPAQSLLKQNGDSVFTVSVQGP